MSVRSWLPAGDAEGGDCDGEGKGASVPGSLLLRSLLQHLQPASWVAGPPKTPNIL